MNLKILRLVILLITFLYLVNFASAEFGVYSEKKLLKLCRCSELDDLIKIKNTGTQSTIYSLSSNLDFVEINPHEFELSPGDIQNIQITVKAPCKTLKKNLKIKIKSDKGDSESLVKQIVAGQCQNLRTNLYTEANEINPCEPLDYRLLIKNIGPFTEKYFVSSEFDEYIDFSNREIEIASGDIRKINATLMLPCNIYGETPIVFYVQAEKNKLHSRLQHDLLINQYYAYTLKVEEENKVCEEEAEPIKVEIENDVETPNIYYLELVGVPSFIKLSSQNVSLEGKEEAEVDIILGLKEGMNLGFYDFTLKSQTAYGDIFQEKNISVNITNCYDLEIDILEKNPEFCTEEKQLVVNVKNNGEERESIKLETLPDWAEFDTKRVTLDFGEEKNVTLTMNPEDVDAEYDLNVEASLVRNNITVTDSTKVKVISQGTCHYVKVSKTKYSIRRDTENSTTIKLTNVGRTEEKYTLNLRPEFWITINQSAVTLQPGETKTLTLLSEHTQETEFGDYPVNLTVKLGDIEYMHELVVSLQDKPIYVKTYQYFAQRPCQAATLILVIAAIILFLLAISLKKLRWKLRTKPFFTSIIILIALLVIFAGLIYNYKGVPRLYEPIDYSEASATHYIWSQDKKYELDLSSFVSDPDVEDELLLSFLEEPENIDMAMENGKIVFTPNEGWYGTEEVVIVATDSKGASAESPEITLEVVKRDKYSLFGAYEKLCWYVNWIILLVAFFFLSIVGFKKMRRKLALLKRKDKKSTKRKKRR
ncbi:MAG: hypothetical protein ISS25_02305 [Nanoarchaeota archaeon]|nr:hypothetical protein [DPANN group archaeon]MBL7116636.1 hypothetical protein [Nanoarchaeota archaeon]